MGKVRRVPGCGGQLIETDVSGYWAIGLVHFLISEGEFLVDRKQ